MNTKRENILEALVTQLGTVAGATVYRSRNAAIAREEGTAIVVRPDDEVVEFKPGATLAVRDLVVTVEVIVRGLVADQTADPIVAAAHAAVMADPTLGGTVGRIIEEGTKWDFELADLDAVGVSLRYKVRYATYANNLTTSP